MTKQKVRPHMSLGPWDQRHSGRGLCVEKTWLHDFQTQTPFFVTSLGAIARRLKSYQQALRSWFPQGQIYYAMKANGATPILQTARNVGVGVDLVSIGELRAALAAGLAPGDLCFAGVGKTHSHLVEALQKQVGWIVVEHLEGELDFLLDTMAQHPQGKTRIAVRINPCVESATHPHLKTGSLDSKFGVLLSDLQHWLQIKQKSKGDFTQAWLAPLEGVHVHVGSQLLDKTHLKSVVKSVMEGAHLLQEFGCRVTHLDFGGGLGVGEMGVDSEDKDIVEHVDHLCGLLTQSLKDHPQLTSLQDRCQVGVCLEPGRSVVASSTLMVTQVLYARQQGGIQVVYVDAGMNDFPRPALYGARHGVEWVDGPRGTPDPSQWVLSKVVGPVCESADVLARDVVLPPMGNHQGHLLAFFEAGAYCSSMSSCYNMRPPASEIFLESGGGH